MPKDDRVRPSKLRLWTVINAGVLAALLVAEYLVAERTAFTTLLVYAPQQGWAILPLLLMWISLRRREWLLLAINGGVLATLALTLLGINFPAGAKVGSGEPLRILTYNIHYGEDGLYKVISTIQDQNPDIVCMQETPVVTGVKFGPTPHQWLDVMTRYFPGWKVHRAGDVTTMTRFPVLEAQNWTLRSDEARALLKVRIQTPQGPLSVFNLHLDNGYHLVKISPMDRLNGALKDCTEGRRIRREQFEAVRPHLLETKEAFVLAGDFNNPPRGLLYNQISELGQDAFKLAGQGPGNTFPARIPLIRIDYLWLGQGVSARSAAVVNSRASDHRALTGEIDLPTRTDK